MKQKKNGDVETQARKFIFWNHGFIKIVNMKNNLSRTLSNAWSLCGLILFLFLFSYQTPAQGKLDKDGFVKIFDGKTLHGWEGDSTYWSVEDGKIVGIITPATIVKRNTFLIWHGGVTADFELKVENKISEGDNSGINYRSELVDDIPYALRGYQCDIDAANHTQGKIMRNVGVASLRFQVKK